MFSKMAVVSLKLPHIVSSLLREPPEKWELSIKAKLLQLRECTGFVGGNRLLFAKKQQITCFPTSPTCFLSVGAR